MISLSEKGFLKLIAIIFLLISTIGVILAGKYLLSKDEVTKEENITVELTYNFFTEVEGLEIISPEESPFSESVRKLYENSGGLKEVNVTLTDEIQNSLRVKDLDGQVYVSMGVNKQKDLNKIDIYIQIKPEVFENKDDANRMLSVLILDAMLPVNSLGEQSNNQLAREEVDRYKDENFSYPFVLVNSNRE